MVIVLLFYATCRKKKRFFLYKKKRVGQFCHLLKRLAGVVMFADVGALNSLVSGRDQK